MRVACCLHCQTYDRGVSSNWHRCIDIPLCMVATCSSLSARNSMIGCHTSIYYHNLVLAIRELLDSLFRIGVDTHCMQYLSKSRKLYRKYAKSLFKHSAFLFKCFYVQQYSQSCPKATQKTAPQCKYFVVATRPVLCSTLTQELFEYSPCF